MKQNAPTKVRLDELLVQRGLCESRSKAQGWILAGDVTVNGKPIIKPGTRVLPDVDIVLKEIPKYVSRGGLKLEKALMDFGLDPTGQVCMDVGSSTGGFTDCLLQHGAMRVYAVDVGTNQLHWKIRQDPRVLVMEKTHIAKLSPDTLNPRPAIAVVDVSFISLKKVLPSVVSCLSAETTSPQLVALLKPQFEYLDYCEVKDFRGIVSEMNDYRRIFTGLLSDLTSLLPDWGLTHLTQSPIKGAEGNREFLLGFTKNPAGEMKKDESDFETHLG